MEFNARKCHVLEKRMSEMRHKQTNKMGKEMIPREKEEKDMGVIQEDLLPENHINNII